MRTASSGERATNGAVVGEGSRLGAGSIVHVNAALPPHSRVGMRHYAVAGGNGQAVVTSDLDEARRLLARADFLRSRLR